MSWPQWSLGNIPNVNAGAAALPVLATTAGTGVLTPNAQYTAEQWTQMQQQNWQQWAQWQQQYQQWQQQYGAEFQKSLTAMTAQAATPLPVAAVMPNTSVPPPLPNQPVEKPPLPPEDPPNIIWQNNRPNYSTVPPNQPNNYNTTKDQGSSNWNRNNQNWQNQNNQWKQKNFTGNKSNYDSQDNSMKRPLNTLDITDKKRGKFEASPKSQDYVPPSDPQTSTSTAVNTGSNEEISEAEKKFIKQFADWEAQFAQWKKQNQDHPNKVLYREYEKKWEAWRAQLLERREQMRKKRMMKSSTNQAIKSDNNETITLKTSNTDSQFPAFNKPPNINNLPNDKPRTENSESNFLLSSSSRGGIPGLDLVKDDNIETKDEPAKKPDMDALSKDIVNILSDQKIMNMLSLVSQNQAINSSKPVDTVSNINAPSASNKSMDSFVVANDSKNISANVETQNPTANDDFSNHGNSNYDNDHLSSMDEQTRTSFGGQFERDNKSPFSDYNTRKDTFKRHDSDHFRERNYSDQNRNDYDRFSNRSDGPNINQSQDNFLDNRILDHDNDLFNRNIDLDRRYDNFNQDQGSNFYNRGPENRNYDDFSRNPDRGYDFNRDLSENALNFNRNLSDFNRNPSNFNRNAPDFNQNPSDFNRNPSDFNRDPSDFNRNPPDFNRDPSDFNRNAPDFKRNPSDFNRNLDLNRGEIEFNRNASEFNRNASEFNQNTSDLNWREPNSQRSSLDFNKNPSDRDNFNRNIDFGNAPCNFERNIDSYNNQDNFNRGFDVHNQRNVDNFNRGPDNFNRNANNLNRNIDNFDNNFNARDAYNSDRFSDNASNQDNRRLDDNGRFSRNKYNDERSMAIASDADSFSIDKRSVASMETSRDGTSKTNLDEIWKPLNVVDYDHRSQKIDEFDVIIETFYTFDYHHKPVNRIPYPERPKWLANILCRFREFEPQIKRVIERYPERYDRRPYQENYRRVDYYQEERYPKRDYSRDYDSPITHDSRRYDTDTYNDNSYDNRNRKPFETDRIIFSSSSSNRRSFSERDDVKTDLNKEINYESDKSLTREEQDPFADFESFASPPKPNFDFKPATDVKKDIMLIEDLLNKPGRFNRPPRIVIILRGPPGSGKTFLAKLIKDKEVENGGSPPRILSLDDYFMVEQEKEIEEDGRMVKVKEMVYEYEEGMEASYKSSLLKAFKKTITDGYFPFIIVDNINDKVKYFNEMWSFAKQNGFQVYACQLELDVQMCTKRNVHGRSEVEIERCVKGWEETPSHYCILDATSLVQAGSIPEVEMEEINSPAQNDYDSDTQNEDEVRSKWDTFDCSLDTLAKLDGINKPLRHSRTMEDYLQIDDEWLSKATQPGKKRVRWADLEERNQQEKMRAIGFVVGQTNWNRMMDPTHGSSALTQTKYIERVRKY